MPTIREIHLKNLKMAVERFGKMDNLIDAIEQCGEGSVSKKYLQNVMNEVVTKGYNKPRDLGHLVCRKIEKALGEEAGWMDVEHGDHDEVNDMEKELLRYFRLMTEGQQKNLIKQAEEIKNENQRIVQELKEKLS